MVTPLFSGGTFPARSWKLNLRCPVRCNTALNDSLNLPRFYSRLPVQFLFLPRLCFLLFHALDFTQLLIFATSLFYSFHVLCFLGFLMGVTFGLPLGSAQPALFRFVFISYFYFSPSCIIFCCFTIFLIAPRMPIVRHFTIFMIALRCPSFVAPRYLWMHRDAIFCYATIFMIAPRCYLLLRYDICDCTAMPSFVAPRYLWLHRDAHLLRRFTIVYFPVENPFPNLHPHFIICNELLSISKNNTAVLLRDLASTVFQIYAALVASRATRR